MFLRRKRFGVPPRRGEMFIVGESTKPPHSFRSAMSRVAKHSQTQLLLWKFEIDFKEEYVFKFYN